MRSKLNPTKITNVILFYLRFCGLWKPAASAASIIHIVYAVYGISFLMTFSGIYTLCMCINLFFIPDLKELTVASYMSLTEFALLVKAILFYLLNRKLQKLFGTLNEFVLDSDEERALVQERLQFFFKIMVFYYAVSNGGVLITEFGSAFSPVPRLPYSGWYPYLDWKHSRRDYWIVFTYQSLGMSSTCNMNVTVDSFACFFMYMISVEMELLGMRLRGMGHKDIPPAGAEAMTSMEGGGGRYLYQLIDQIKLHENMLESIGMLEKYFSVAFFSQISVSGMVICSLTNELAHVSHILFNFLAKSYVFFTDFYSQYPKPNCSRPHPLANSGNTWPT